MENRKKSTVYSPITAVRRDFNSKFIFRDEKTGQVVNSDRDLKQIIEFYRQETEHGTLLNLGAGPTHLHYMAAVEDKLAQITALDLSQRNIRTMEEFLQAISSDSKKPKENFKYVTNEDIVMLCYFAENCGQLTENIRSGDEVLKSLHRKSLINGKPDFIVGDMHDLSILGYRKFDNILIGFALYVNTEEELLKLFQQIREHLNPCGKVIIADFQVFGEEDINEDFSEDENVLKKYPHPLDFSLEVLVSILIKAGFTSKNIHQEVKDLVTEDLEKERGYKYIFIAAQNK